VPCKAHAYVKMLGLALCVEIFVYGNLTHTILKIDTLTVGDMYMLLLPFSSLPNKEKGSWLIVSSYKDRT